MEKGRHKKGGRDGKKHAEHAGVHSSNTIKEGKTYVKNANASGLGSMGRNDTDAIASKNLNTGLQELNY